MRLEYLSENFVEFAHDWVDEARKTMDTDSPFGRVVLDASEQRKILAHSGTEVLGAALLERAGVKGGPLHAFFSRQLLALNGDEHRRLRRLVSPTFTPRALAKYRDTITRSFDELASPHLYKDRFDVAAAAETFPVHVICELFGAPPSLTTELRHWVPKILSMFDPDLEQRLPEIEAAVVDMEVALGELISKRRSTRGEDLLSRLISVEVDGDQLDDKELVMLAAAVLIGGTESTRLQLLNVIALTASDPAVWQELRHTPSLAGDAVEEAMRYRPVPHAAYRRTESGEEVVCDFLAANRDPAVHDRPHEFRLQRPTFDHLTFSFGPHHCLGASLARMEMVEALSWTVERIPQVVSVRVGSYPEAYSNSWGPASLELVLPSHAKAKQEGSA